MKLFCELRGELGQNGVRNFRHVERLGNILKNVQNLYTKLSDFCEQEDIPKPKSLRNNIVGNIEED